MQLYVLLGHFFQLPLCQEVFFILFLLLGCDFCDSLLCVLFGELYVSPQGLVLLSVVIDLFLETSLEVPLLLHAPHSHPQSLVLLLQYVYVLHIYLACPPLPVTLAIIEQV